MADDSEAEVTSDFPPQPKYYMNYGPNGNPLPPPLPPADGTFTVFGENRQLDEQTPSLEIQGIKCLFDPKGKRKEELRKLVISSRTHFVNLVQSLAKDEDQDVVNEKFQELDTCFINMLYLVNEMRSTQARVELKNFMKEQIKAKKQSILLLNETARKAREELEQHFTLNAPAGTSSIFGDVEMVDSSAASKEVDTELALKSLIDEEYAKFSG